MSNGSRLDLRRTQELFWSLIAAPEGVARGAAELVREGKLAAGDLSFMIRPGKKMTPAERLDVYANMYFYRLRDCLADDFPKLAAVVGGARFHNLVTDFLLQHPSTHPSLRYLGEPLPPYLRRHALADAFPFAADLACLEWSRVEVFDAEDARPLAREDLSGLPAEQVEDLAFRLIPACRLLHLDWSVAPVWRAVDDLEGSKEPGNTHSAAIMESDSEGFAEPLPIIRPASTPTTIIVWRRNFSVLHRTVPADEAACLAALKEGSTLPRLCELALENPPAEEPEVPSSEPAPALPPDMGGDAALMAATRRMTAWLDGWVTAGLLRRA